MTRAEFVEFHRNVCERMHQTMVKKNNDYAGAGDDDPFWNFTRVDAMSVCTTEQGFLARMLDKVSRIATFVKRGVLQVSDESAVDTLVDLANYAILMAGYIESKRRAQALAEKGSEY